MPPPAGNLPSSPEAASGSLPIGVCDALCLLLLLLAVAGVQLAIPYPYDADTAYHFAVGRLIREHGLLHAFPWTPFSWLAEHYADKELLFHLSFAALNRVDYISAARVVGTIFGWGILATVYAILRCERVRLPVVWALLPVAASAIFAFRFALVRPHLLSISLALLVLWSAVRRRLWLLAAVAAVYPWAYVAFWQIPLLMLLAAEAGRVLCGERPDWKPALVVLLGVGLGVALHPNTVSLLELNWIVLANVLLENAWRAKAEFDLGTEFLSPPLFLWLQKLLLGALMAVTALVLSWRARKRDGLALSCALAAVGFGLLTAKTLRFVEYFMPLSVVALALVSRRLGWRALPGAALAVAVVYTLLFGRTTWVNLTRRGDDLPPALAEQLQARIPPGAQVFTPDWQMTGTYLMALPERRFIVALDPTLFAVNDPELYRLWYRISRDAPAELIDILHQRFRARYVLFFYRPDFAGLLTRLTLDPRAELLGRTRILYLFDIGAPLATTGGNS